jgi:murein DD-endopeptidase MepM/ murein hydrolase activator NlpD
VIVAPAFLSFASAQDAAQSDRHVEAENVLPPAGAKVGNVRADEGKIDLARRANYAEAMNDVAERQKVFAGLPEHFTLDGSYTQGGILFGQTEIGAKVTLDGEDVMVDDDGRFIVGFGRDSALTALLVVTLPDGAVERRSIGIADREFPVQRIDGIDQSKVSGFTEEQLAKISKDTALKKSARQETQRLADWSVGFDWPLTGRISGVFGSQRILNGEPKNPHSGLDIAAATGTPIRAPAPGIVRLAEGDMYFEGGLVLLDHGHWLESAFLHMSRIDVVPGQRVEKGDIIGAVGATGRVTGPHLHWSMKWAGRLVDPQLTLDPLANVKPAGAGE